MPPIEQVEPIFHEALCLPEGVDRAAWLARRCGDNQELLAEVSSLLTACDAIATQSQPARISTPPVVPNEQFGAYRLVHLLGRGGMSAVYLGERVDGQFDKRVAVKVMAAHWRRRVPETLPHGSPVSATCSNALRPRRFPISASVDL